MNNPAYLSFFGVSGNDTSSGSVSTGLPGCAIPPSVAAILSLVSESTCCNSILLAAHSVLWRTKSKYCRSLNAFSRLIFSEADGVWSHAERINKHAKKIMVFIFILFFGNFIMLPK